MYLPHDFKETRSDILLKIIQDNALGSLITYSDQGLDVNHLPFEYDEKTHSLWAHIAKENDLVQLLQQEQDVLVIFKMDLLFLLLLTQTAFSMFRSSVTVLTAFAKKSRLYSVSGLSLFPYPGRSMKTSL